MKQLIENIVNEVVSNLREAEMLKPGTVITIPRDKLNMAGRIIRAMYGVSPDDFENLGGGRFKYKSNVKKTRPSTKKPKFKSQDLGRKEDETEQEYLERVREINGNFAETEKEMPGEEWRPIVNKGRYFAGETDYTKSYEVSNMGRIRIIDYQDPMRSRISTGYDAPGKGARNFHLDIPGFKTTPPIHTLVADAWLPEPEGGVENYDVEHIDGNYHNNRVDNLRYVPKKGRRGKKNAMMNNAEAPLTENNLRKLIKECVRKVLRESINEVSGWTLEKDDVAWVNGEEDGRKPWMVRLWTGSGYYLPAFGAFAESEEDALEKVVAYLDKKGDNDFFCDEYVKQMEEELKQEGKDDEEIWEEIDQSFYYVDSTMDGGGCHYVFLENLSVYPYDEKKFK